MNTIAVPDIFRRLSAPVPPHLESVIGYPATATAEWVAFYRTPCGDEVIYDDGWVSGTGEWDAWLEYTRHPQVRPHLIDPALCLSEADRAAYVALGYERHLLLTTYNFGNSDEEAAYWLVLDRKERVAYAAPVAEAGRFLRQINMPNPPYVTITAADMEEMRRQIEAAFRNAPRPTYAEIQAQMEAHQAEIVAMLNWLDATPEVTP